MRTLSLLFATTLLLSAAPARSGGELRFCLHSDPKSFDPFLVYDEPSEAVRYLTGAPLVRLNRKTQQITPELATSWKLSNAGRQIRFEIRPGVRFSDGSPLTLGDVEYSLKTFFDPAKQVPDADAFGVDLKSVQIRAIAPASISVAFPKTVAGLERLFDSVPIVSARALSLTAKPTVMPTLGPFRVAQYRSGSLLLLARNEHYWKRDTAGIALPYLDSVRIYIQSNSALDLLRFQHGETDLIFNVDPESFSRLSSQNGVHAFDIGPSLDAEQWWFNENAKAPLPAYKKAWFQSRNFRAALSTAINRADLSRIAYFNRASPSRGPVSPANARWFNADINATSVDVKQALQLLARDGFRLSGQTLYDNTGNAVEFSLITNSGNKARERVAALLQADVQRIGIKLNIVSLDFPALLQRVTQRFDYESCLLGLVNNDLDPNGQMNVWLSSGSNHAWNPGQSAPATAWEKEIDSLMTAQAADTDPKRRKAEWDRVQAISAAENPALYLVTKHSLTAFGPAVANPSPVVLFPQAFWNAEEIYLARSR